LTDWQLVESQLQKKPKQKPIASLIYRNCLYHDIKGIGHCWQLAPGSNTKDTTPIKYKKNKPSQEFHGEMKMTSKQTTAELSILTDPKFVV